MNTQVRITADPTADGDANEVFVVYDGSVPGSEAPTGTTYGTVALEWGHRRRCTS